MGKIYRLKSRQLIPASIEDTWRFFSDPRNLAKITPSFLNLKVTNELFGEEMYAGQVMTYTVKPLLGIPVSWMTEITHVEAPLRFVDEQRKGPYQLWHHQHHFRSVEGGVEMTDLVHYRLPLGPLSGIAHAMVVKDKLKEIFVFRYHRIIELFGEWPGGKMELEIE
ncbi:MAG TPA: SRPBCC family protein [Flavisolibacter sp.]|nr:SRPBCC family protein [Flavisolibacter sp.]